MGDGRLGVAAVHALLRSAVVSRTAGVIAFTAAIAVAAASVLAFTPDAGAAPPVGFRGALIVVALLFAVAEATPVHLHFRSQAHSMSLNDIALVFGLFTLGAVSLVAAIVVGGTLAVVVRRQRPIKAAFNLAQYALTAGVAVAVFRLLISGGDPFGASGWVAASAAAVCSALVGVVLVSAVIRLAGGGGMLGELPLLVALAFASSGMSTCVALIAVTLLHDQPAAVWLVAVPAAACVAAFTVTVRQQHRRRHTEVLYEAMRRVQGARGLAHAVQVLLEESREIVAAADAAIVLLPERVDGWPLLARTGAADCTLEPRAFDELALVHQVLSDAGGTVVLAGGREAHPLDAFVAELGMRDALVAALAGADGTAAVLCVGNRLGDVATFTGADATLLTTFAQHAAVVLENDRMLDELRHMAYADTLTGLPNRAQVTQLLERAVTHTQAETTVLFIDLDDFKTVNDSLGHTAGDDLLADVGRRLTAIAEGAVVARFGGDEFAILLDARSGAEEVAERVLATFARPFHVAGHEVRTSASIGVASAGIHARSVEELLRNADAAMYAAKDRGKRAFALYVPELHERAARRQELASALERGIARGELEVHYQPITTLADGSVYGLEALVRWRHPDLGLLAPGAFVALAEERGFSEAITRQVLADACTRTARWRQQFPELVVSVNLSASDFLGLSLVADVEQTLAQSGLPSTALLLEITEQTALREPELTAERLAELRRRGVRVALDDFGTGYSSLAQLRNLPIDCLKIAKEFVDGLEDPTGESVIVAIVRLAQAFDLDVVAEGIENAAAAAVLRRHCARGQGYHFARPMHADDVTAYLDARPPRAAVTALALAL